MASVRALFPEHSDSDTDEAREYHEHKAFHYIRPEDDLPIRIAWPEDASQDPVCPIKLFDPMGSGEWWIAAYDPERDLAEGAATVIGQPDRREWGVWSMRELLEAIRDRGWAVLERDKLYKPQRMSEVLCVNEHHRD